MSEALGLANDGANNCFVNVVVQTLWHQEPFRSFLLALPHRKVCKENHCIVCALLDVFRAFASQGASSDKLVAPTKLHEALSASFDALFPRDGWADAEEAFATILDAIVKNVHASGGDFVRGTFEHRYKEFLVCPHCHTEKSLNVAAFVMRSYAHEICSIADSTEHKRLVTAMKLSHNQEKRFCPNEECLARQEGKLFQQQRALNAAPTCLVLSCAWNTNHPERAFTRVFNSLLSGAFVAQDLFDKVEDARWAYKARSVILFYGGHYVAIIWREQDKAWFLFDDAKVSRVGTCWGDVKRRCAQHGLQPVLLFYQKCTDRELGNVAEEEDMGPMDDWDENSYDVDMVDAPDPWMSKSPCTGRTGFSRSTYTSLHTLAASSFRPYASTVTTEDPYTPGRSQVHDSHGSASNDYLASIAEVGPQRSPEDSPRLQRRQRDGYWQQANADEERRPLNRREKVAFYEAPIARSDGGASPRADVNAPAVFSASLRSAKSLLLTMLIALWTLLRWLWTTASASRKATPEEPRDDAVEASTASTPLTSHVTNHTPPQSNSETNRAIQSVSETPRELSRTMASSETNQRAIRGRGCTPLSTSKRAGQAKQLRGIGKNVLDRLKR